MLSRSRDGAYECALGFRGYLGRSDAILFLSVPKTSKMVVAGVEMQVVAPVASFPN